MQLKNLIKKKLPTKIRNRNQRNIRNNFKTKNYFLKKHLKIKIKNWINHNYKKKKKKYNNNIILKT